MTGKVNLLTSKEMASLLSYGHTFLESAEYDKATTIFNGVLLFDPSNAYAHAMLAVMEQKKSNYTQAIEHYSQSIDHDGRNPTTLTNRGECYLNLGRLEEAAKDFKAAIDRKSVV